MDNNTILEILASQYKASLGMLRNVIEEIPHEQWDTEEYNNPNWQIAYHTIWAVTYYLSANPDRYIALKTLLEGAESLGGAQAWENPEEGIVVNGVHTKEELISFIDDIEENVEERLKSLPLAENSGFEWYSYTRFELHINSIRHTQHHTAQLIERLKAKGITGFAWWIDQNPPQQW